jgi:hypothetical protein
MACCDRGYDRPSGRPRVSDPATYCSSTPRIQPPAVARWHNLLHGLATTIHEITGLGNYGNPLLIPTSGGIEPMATVRDPETQSGKVQSLEKPSASGDQKETTFGRLR